MPTLSVALSSFAAGGSFMVSSSENSSSISCLISTSSISSTISSVKFSSENSFVTSVFLDVLKFIF